MYGADRGRVKGVIVDWGKRALGQLLDRSEHRDLLEVAKGERSTGCPGAGGPADSVDVAFGIVWQLVVDDMRDSIDIDSPRDDVGRHEDLDHAAIERGERALASALALVRVDRPGGDSLAG